MPYKNFAPCDKKSCDSTQACVVVAATGDTTGTKYALGCVAKNNIPKVDVAAEGKLNDKCAKDDACHKNDTCKKDSDCKTTEQCVVVYSDHIATATLVGDDHVVVWGNRCVEKADLPTAVLTGSAVCGVSGAQCEPNKSCVVNSFSPEVVKNICYAKTYISTDAGGCPTSGASNKCGADSEQKYCMEIVVGQKKEWHCVNAANLPFGPKGLDSSATCKSDKDCTQANGPSYCLFNPATKLAGCFSEKQIFTDMKNVSAQMCGTGADAKKCECKTQGIKTCAPDGKPSICTQHYSQAWLNAKVFEFVCIDYANKEALGTGLTTYVPTYANERQERFAPQLEIDIPTVNFTEKIFGQTSGEDTVFSVPYLALYINGVYKYGIGFGALFATIMIIYAGFTYMASFGNAKAIAGAKETATNAVLGLLLLLSVYTILYVINPDLTNMKAFQIAAPKQEIFFVEQEGFNETSDGEIFAKTITSITPGTLPDYKQGAYESTKYLGKNGEEIKCEDGSIDNLRKSGCGVMSGTEVLNHAGIKITPEEFAAWASQIGAHETCKSGTNGNLVCKNIEKKFPGYTCTWLSKKGGTDPALVAKKVQEGKPVVFSCHGCSGKTASGKDRTYKAHYMVLKGVSADGQQFAVNDPASRNQEKMMTTILSKEFTEGRIVNTYVIEKK